MLVLGLFVLFFGFVFANLAVRRATRSEGSAGLRRVQAVTAVLHFAAFAATWTEMRHITNGWGSILVVPWAVIDFPVSPLLLLPIFDACSGLVISVCDPFALVIGFIGSVWWWFVPRMLHRLQTRGASA